MPIEVRNNFSVSDRKAVVDHCKRFTRQKPRIRADAAQGDQVTSSDDGSSIPSQPPKTP
jgi:hypothetical protein